MDMDFEIEGLEYDVGAVGAEETADTQVNHAAFAFNVGRWS